MGNKSSSLYSFLAGIQVSISHGSTSWHRPLEFHLTVSTHRHVAKDATTEYRIDQLAVLKKSVAERGAVREL